mgnify:CR=1 FL=1
MPSILWHATHPLLTDSSCPDAAPVPEEAASIDLVGSGHADQAISFSQSYSETNPIQLQRLSHLPYLILRLEDNDHVKFVVGLSDLNQPFSCSQWGNMGSSGIPKIIDDTGYPIFNMFNTGSAFPSLVMIDHNMNVFYKEAGYYNTFVQDASVLIDEMLSNMENSLIMSSSFNSNIIIFANNWFDNFIRYN